LGLCWEGFGIGWLWFWTRMVDGPFIWGLWGRLRLKRRKVYPYICLWKWCVFTISDYPDETVCLLPSWRHVWLRNRPDEKCAFHNGILTYIIKSEPKNECTNPWSGFECLYRFFCFANESPRFCIIHSKLSELKDHAPYLEGRQSPVRVYRQYLLNIGLEFGWKDEIDLRRVCS
jgi:hypothetical protein